MSMNVGKSEDGMVTDINVTPLVDVSLVLVIIFMVSAPLFQLPSLEVELPQATTQEGEERENVTITITADGLWAINDKELTAETAEPVLYARLAKSGEKFVIIRADRGASHGELLLAMAMAKRAGAKSITIATEKP